MTYVLEDKFQIPTHFEKWPAFHISDFLDTTEQTSENCKKLFTLIPLYRKVDLRTVRELKTKMIWSRDAIAYIESFL